jgi:NADH-quinone oxidoreductase subunit I
MAKLPLVPILQGMGVTLQNFFSKPVTIEYPEHKKPVADRFRGRIYLKLETCI